jgi:hypothetical protein
MNNPENVRQQIEDMLVQEETCQGSLEIILELAKRAGFTNPKHIQVMTDVCLSLAVWAYVKGATEATETIEMARLN